MNHRGKGIRIMATILCIIVAAVLVFVARWAKNRDYQRESELRKKAESISTTDTSNSEEINTVSVSSSSSEETADQTLSPETSSSSEKEETPVTSISCRGDAFNTGAGDSATLYPSELQRILNENGITSVTVKDYTWDMVGSLSQLRFAGIDEATINDYIAKHRANLTSSQLGLTETQLRTDMATKDLTRDDTDALPVICIGYNGGWGWDINELVEQEQKILSTYSNTDRYIIMGFYPNGWTDTAGYDTAQSTAFGEHYLQLNQAISHPAFSNEGRSEIAQALYDKMNELGYLGDSAGQ
ncbi:MAG: hypothetical protein ACOYBC_08205 [Bilifractor sp.]|jgi:hypothetical protein